MTKNVSGGTCQSLVLSACSRLTTYPADRIETAVPNWAPSRPRSSSSELSRACLRLVSVLKPFVRIFPNDIPDGSTVHVVEEVQDPEAGHQGHVESTDDLLLKLAPVRDAQSVDDLLGVGQELARLEVLLGFLHGGRVLLRDDVVAIVLNIGRGRDGAVVDMPRLGVDLFVGSHVGSRGWVRELRRREKEKVD